MSSILHKNIRRNKEVHMSEISKKKKPENARWNLLLILDILKKYTNNEYPMSASEICKKVNQEFIGLVDEEHSKVISIDTVKRTLDALVCEFFGKSQILDFEVRCVMKTKDGYTEYDYDNEQIKGLKKFYYYEGEFSTSEVRTLIDAIETHSYFSDEDVCGIIEKLIHLRPCAYRGKRYHDSARENRDEDSLLLMNIDYLSEIIDRQNRAQIEYCYYNEEKRLVTRPGYPKEVEPLTLMWSNGYYYMLAYNEKYGNIVNYRVDRIRDIIEIKADKKNKELISEREEFNPVQYRMEHPVMYAGEKEHFILLCRDTGKNYVVNMIMDVFGKNTKISRASDKLMQDYLGHDKIYYDNQGIKWLKVSFESAPSGVELWATQYCTDCIIVQPDESRQRVIKRLKEGEENYNIYK